MTSIFDPDEAPVPVAPYDFLALIERVEAFRKRHPLMPTGDICARLGIKEWYFYHARNNIATDDEAFEFTWDERIRPDDPIVMRRRGA